ncbi:MAG TPA: ABC transporter permease, partial [Caldimonas sp.]|nr:ABC transporter permease [Caldimonas sp.]
MLRRPGFAAAATLALALGIGANAAIFAAVDAVLLRPMPFPHADRLYVPVSVNKARGIEGASVSFGDVEDWRAATDVFSAVALWRPIQRDLVATGDPQRVKVAEIGPDFFRVIEVTPVTGRLFQPGDHEANALPVAILTYGLWQGAFGGAQDVVGQTVRIADVPTEIIGVLPPRIAWPNDTQLYLSMRPAIFDREDLTRRDNLIFQAIARLRDEVPVERAKARLASMAARLEHDEPVIRKGWTNTLITLRDAIVDDDLRIALFMLLGAVGAVLLIACANVANLALVRGSGRVRELAVRLSLGASRHRLVQQLVVESLIVTTAGAIAGSVLAVPIMRGLVAMAPNGTPFLDDVRLNPRMLAAAAAAGAV